MADINNDFAYPNQDSYSSFGRDKYTQGNKLYHGVIYSMVIESNQDDTRSIWEPQNGSNVRWTPGMFVRKNASTTLAKRFQFNPASLQFTMQMTNLDPAASATAGGSAPPTVGAASTALSLAFNREIEVFRAMNGHPTTPSYFREIGVQKDILDLYRVLIGPNPTGVQDGSAIVDLNSELFDAGVAGAQINQQPVIVSFNPQLTYYGTVMGMVYEFQKFNHRMVPTIASVTLTLDILNINSSRAINSQALRSNSGTVTVPNSTAVQRVQNSVNGVINSLLPQF